jgi:cyclophilin family peptidyl-prolyl cis-trans isomerase/HEAT repeat protein
MRRTTVPPELEMSHAASSPAVGSSRLSRALLQAAVTTAVIILLVGCAARPPAVPTAPAVAEVTWEQKLAWIVRLEDQRILVEPNPPAPRVIRPATREEPALLSAPAPANLLALLEDAEARVRRRAALSVGRVRLAEGVEPLARLLSDPEVEVRQMAAFALGLIGHPSARAALLQALSDPAPIVQGRAAEALGLIGDRRDAAAVGAMVRAHVEAGALAGIEPDDLTHPLAPAAEAVRLGLYALVRLGGYEQIAAAVLDGGGQPISRWWPIAYALGRAGDPRAEPALLVLLDTPGRYTAAFAARGLGMLKAQAAAAPLRRILERPGAHPAVVIQAVRALASLGDSTLVERLARMVVDDETEPALRVEALTSLSELATAEHVDLLLELVTDPSPWVRAAALRTLARVDPDTFIVTLAGMEPDREWIVRAAVASGLGLVPHERSFPLLSLTLDDKDPRVVSSAIAALAASKAPEAARLILERTRADDFAVRAAAITALAALKAPGTAQAAVDMYRSAEADTTYVARAAALAALSRVDPAAARPVLEDALRDRDWAVRLRAAELLREQGVTGFDAVIRPAAPGRFVDDPAWQALVSPPFSPHAFIETDKGTIEIELAVLDAPLTVDNFITLARKGFFDGLTIHRVVPDFVVQDGDPRGDGEGGPGYTIRDEINQRPYLRGTVGMALDWNDTGGSQFFITHSPQPHLDGRYTVFGHVVAGMDVVDRIVPGDVVRRVRIRDGVNPE